MRIPLNMQISIDIPKEWAGQQVHFFWDAGCEGLIWVNGEPVQGLTGGDGCDQRKDFILTTSSHAGMIYFQFCKHM